MWRWRIDVRVRVGAGDRTEARSAGAATVQELRRLVERARANPDVLAWSITSNIVLDRTNRPTACAWCRGELEPEHTRHAATGVGRHVTEVDCRGCPGHVRTPCPGCGRATVWLRVTAE